MQLRSALSLLFSIGHCQKKALAVPGLFVGAAKTYFSHTIIRNSSVGSWSFTVEPFWKLQAIVSDCKLEIKSFDPTKNVNGNLIEVQGYNTKNKKNEESQSFKVVSEKDKRVVLISNNNANPGDSLIVFTPPAFNIDILASGSSSIEISNLESTFFKAQNDCGNIVVKNIKSPEINLSTNVGNINCNGILHGNVNLKALNGNISVEKIQAPNANIQVNLGGLTLRDVYMDKLSATIDNGNVFIQSLHGQSRIKCGHGNVSIGTAEGETTVTTDSGVVDVYAAVSSSMNLMSRKGIVNLSFPQDLKATFDLKASSIVSTDVEVDSDGTKNTRNNELLGSVNGGGPLIKAEAINGSINLEKSSWIKRIAKFPKLVQEFKAS